MFAEHLHAKVLAGVPHRHIIFSIPKRLRAFFRYDRSLNDILFQAAWGSIRECLGQGGIPAAVLTLQTAGEALNFNPHLHGALADGVFLTNGTFKPFTEINLKLIQDSFQNLVLAALHQRELIDDNVVEQILSQEHSGFSVWVGDAFQDPESERFVARYIERGPVSLEKLGVHDNIVTYTTKSDFAKATSGHRHSNGGPRQSFSEGGDNQTLEFEPLEFLALLTSHLPKKWESLTRYYGFYSCRSRGERALLGINPLATEPLPEDTSSPSKTWAACMKRIFEINPLECPKCKADMRIVAFLQDPHEIAKIMQNLGIEEPRMPEQIPRAPPKYDPLIDQIFDEF